MVSFRDGIIKSIPGVDVIRQLPSFKKMELAVQPGFKQVCLTSIDFIFLSSTIFPSSFFFPLFF
jgi:hypothetical protein